MQSNWGDGGPRRAGGEGGPQLWVSESGSIYALLPAEQQQHDPPPRARGLGGLAALSSRDDGAQNALAQFLHRQQQHHQQQQQQQQQQDMDFRHLAQQQRHYDPRVEEASSSAGREQAIATLLQAIQNQNQNHQHDLIPFNAGPSTHGPPLLALPGPPLALSARAPAPRRPPVSHDSPSNSDSQSPPPSTRERSSQPGASAQLSAKEKNRQAQRRFRERQKTRINALEQDLQTANVRIAQLNQQLQSKLSDREREVTQLKEENAMLRGRMEGKQQGGSNVLLPAEALQSLLHMSGVRSEGAAAAGNNGHGNGHSGYRRKRSDDGL
ncbi:hypothetical protein TSOC_005526 [Tetrabaena socialis]|uniref:BZIP domain-containing protein n=1 Tax=Tetrabaena socialis TaxID=47790 RepID=A0A2J8A643_9CHLO|nr:hypothetical protein TSOC_005526 [Tetrabaena socialis]|eukprot:PNH07967.1 hypothetical protein TSOC_005526 [Tetrabaena socialis]